jgi:trehalose 6-phosphate phosphatase
MKALLNGRNQSQLALLAQSNVLLAFDYDGTLAPIVPHRERAHMRDFTQTLLRSVCKLYPCVVISGRSKKDVELRLGDAQLFDVVGNHGLEPGGDLATLAHETALARPLLDEAIQAYPGVEIEDKKYSLSVHYRHSRSRRAALAAIHEAVAKLPVPMRLVAGKLVVNVLPAQAPHKGTALLELRERARTVNAFYVGDDVTDEDVFSIDQPESLLSVRVGRSRRSAARYFLRDQLEIDALLWKLLELKGGRLAP